MGFTECEDNSGEISPVEWRSLVGDVNGSVMVHTAPL